MKDTRPPHGLVIVHTGDGKGKTTAALGLALRAWGDGLRVLILQFIKGGWRYGELDAIAALAKNDAGGTIEVRQRGLGFTRKGDVDAAEHKRAAQAALAEARAAITSGAWDLVILDEINYAVKFGLLETSDVLALLDARPPALHVVLTGRDAAPEVIARADLVTEMHLVKHPFQHGVKAQRGIEF
ncbi:MAG: cob(I)yrinic acid a,c-diamide adenosyltransferase [Selenomonas sp.]|nr:cob(I)yrinic acid a,c-diamide adenosyltransferase [Selenomonas sp.]